VSGRKDSPVERERAMRFTMRFTRMEAEGDDLMSVVYEVRNFMNEREQRQTSDQWYVSLVLDRPRKDTSRIRRPTHSM